MRFLALSRTLVTAALWLGAGAAQAQNSAPETGSVEEPEAERLFAEGRALMARGEHAAACERFEASRRLKPAATGPLLNLALCKEALRDFATAVQLFEESIARDARPDRVAFAERHLSAIRPKVPSLEVSVAAGVAATPGLTIALDGTELPSTSWNRNLAIDGGDHVVTARAPGKRELRVKVELAKEAGRGVVTVVLEDAPPPNPVGYWIGGAGIAATLVGLGFGTDVVIQCGGFFTRVCQGPNSAPTTREREEKLRDVDTRAWIATIATTVGLAATATGAFILLTSRKKSVTATPAVSATLTPMGPWVHGTF